MSDHNAATETQSTQSKAFFSVSSVSLWLRDSIVMVGLALAVLMVVAASVDAQQAKPAPAPATQPGPAARPAPAPRPEVPRALSPHTEAQPLPYSHKTHMARGLHLTCQQCHTNPDPGNLMTFPATSKCMECHNTVTKDTPGIQKLAEYARSEQPIPWVRIYKVLPGVQWSHRKHLQPGTTCATCHAQVAQLDVMAEISGVTSMGGCLNCHALHKATAPSACNACHLWGKSDAPEAKAKKSG